MERDIYGDVVSEFTEKYGFEKAKTIEHILDLFASDEFHDFDKDGMCISCSREKIHQLQENVCVEISDEDGNVLLELLYENGINNGTRLNDYRIDPSKSFTEAGRSFDILKDIALDEKKMRAIGIIKNDFDLKKAQALLDNVKPEIMKLIKDKSYDDYVTGGGTNKTNKHYRDSFEKFTSKGLYWIGVYETVTTTANFY